MKHTKEQIELSESLFAACKAAGIEKPKNIAQDHDGSVWHHDPDKNYEIEKSDTMWWSPDYKSLNHPPYADDWRESLLEWVEPRNGDNSLLDVLSNALASNESADDACKIAYRAYTNEERTTTASNATIYHRAWQDALKWKGGCK